MNFGSRFTTRLLNATFRRHFKSLMAFSPASLRSTISVKNQEDIARK
jgi:hypothetical protein